MTHPHNHEPDRYPARHPVCRLCGEYWWTGDRWSPLPDPSAYTDPPDL